MSCNHYTPQIGQPQRPNQLSSYLNHKLPNTSKREDEPYPFATIAMFRKSGIQHLGMGMLRLSLQEPWSLR